MATPVSIDQTKDRYTRDEARAFEDTILGLVDGWTEEVTATVYTVLYARGMRLDKAHAIRRKKKLTTG